MQIEQQSLRKLIQQAFINHPDLVSKRQLKLNLPFYCIVYCLDPIYISDGQICIQAMLPDFMKVWQHANPLNNTRTPFYNTFKDATRVFNCPIEMINEMPQTYSSPYHPAFIFKGKQDEYKKQRLVIKQLKQVKDMLYVKQWSIQIINMMNTPCFAPVIKITDYQAIRRPLQTLLQIPMSILFEPYMADIMQKGKTLQLREYYKKNPIASNFSVNKQYQSQILNSNISNKGFLDAHDNKIKLSDKASKTAYIYFGEEPKKNQFYYFKKPIGNTYKNINVTDVRRFQNFYDRIITVNQVQNDEQQTPHYSLLDESDQQGQEKKDDKQQQSDADSESSDPLKKLYRKMLGDKRLGKK